MTPLLAVERRWECPNCTLTDVTRQPDPHTRFHPCRGLHGITAPMVPAGTRCKVIAVERGDYIGREKVHPHTGSIMAVRTIRDDGEDCAVFAPSATGQGVSSR